MLQYEDLMGAVARGGAAAADVALLGLQELEGSEQSARAVLSSMVPPPVGPNEVMTQGQCPCVSSMR